MDNLNRGRRLRELREASGLLQRQVGAAFDIDKAAVSSWEAGKTSPDRRKLLQLDELYDAQGEVLRLFGVSRETTAATYYDDALMDRLAQLEAELHALREQASPLEGLSRGDRKKRWKDVGRQVSERMDEVGFNVGDMSALTGLTAPFLSRLAKGAPRGEPDPENLGRVAAELGWTRDSIERILDGGEPAIPQPGEPEHAERAAILEARLRSILSPNDDLFARIDERIARERADKQARLDESP